VTILQQCYFFSNLREPIRVEIIPSLVESWRKRLVVEEEILRAIAFVITS
jgi:hypothetical protein